MVDVSVALSEPRPTPAGSDRYADPHADADERTYAMFTHLVGPLSLVSMPVPLLGLIATIVMWRVRASKSPFLDDHGRDATNFQLTVLAYSVVLTVLLIPTLGLSGLGHLGLAALTLVGCIRGAIASHRGEFYRYPMTIRFLS